MLERERIIEIVVAVFSVFVMIGVMVWIGVTYGDEGVLTEEGGTILVAAIIGFIVLLTAIGVALAFIMNDPEDGLEAESAA